MRVIQPRLRLGPERARQRRFKCLNRQRWVLDSSAACCNTAEPIARPTLLAPLKYLCNSKQLMKRQSSYFARSGEHAMHPKPGGGFLAFWKDLHKQEQAPTFW